MQIFSYIIILFKILSEKGVSFCDALIRHDEDSTESGHSTGRIDGLACEFAVVVRLHLDVVDGESVAAIGADRSQLVARMFDAVQFAAVPVPFDLRRRLTADLRQELDVRVLHGLDLRMQLTVEVRQTRPAHRFDGRRRDEGLTPSVFVLGSDAEQIFSIRFQIVDVRAGDDRRGHLIISRIYIITAAAVQCSILYLDPNGSFA